MLRPTCAEAVREGVRDAMGIVDFIRNGVQEIVIARPTDKKTMLVYKWADPTIPMFSQLTVDADEAAVFFRDGSIVGTLRTAGVGQRHTLSTQNIPFLSNFVDSFTGGRIFKTDLFFVTTRPIYDLAFGGELGPVADPMLGELVVPKIYGTAAFQIIDPEAFLLKYTGMRQSGADDLKWIKGLVMNSIRTVVGEVLVSEQKSMLEILPLQSQLAERFIARAPDLNAIGVKIVSMGEFRINIGDEDMAKLSAAQAEFGKAQRAARIANIGIAEAEAKAKQKQFELDQSFQNESRYVQQLAGGDVGTYAASRAMIGAGAGMAKGGGEGGGGPMMAGAGLGVGMGMAGMLQQGMQPRPQQQYVQPPVAPVMAAGAAVAAGGANVTCPGCSAAVPPGKFCQECGTTLAPRPKFCPSCGTQGAAAAKFCASCGTSFGS